MGSLLSVFFLFGGTCIGLLIGWKIHEKRVTTGFRLPWEPARYGRPDLLMNEGRSSLLGGDRRAGLDGGHEEEGEGGDHAPEHSIGEERDNAEGNNLLA